MALSEEDIKQLAEQLAPMITEMASKAAADHVTKRNESFDKKWKPLAEKIESFSSQAVDAKPKEEDEEKITATKRSIRAEEEVKKLREELKAEKLNAQKAIMKSRIEQDFAKRGLQPFQVKALTSQLLSDGTISLDDAGEAIYRNEYNESVSLNEGLDSYFKGDGKSWLPTVKPNGAGMRPIREPARSEKLSMEEIDQNILDGLQRIRNIT